jgi:hypothetical protein
MRESHIVYARGGNAWHVLHHKNGRHMMLDYPQEAENQLAPWIILASAAD